MGIEQITCKQCGHVWKPRTPNPFKCPNSKCQSQDYDSRKSIKEKTPEQKALEEIEEEPSEEEIEKSLEEVKQKGEFDIY